MANPDRASGFTPVGTLSGAPWQGLVRRIQMDNITVTANDHEDIYVGDPLQIIAGTGLVTVHDSGEATDAVLGVCVGVGYPGAGNPANEVGMFNPADLEKRYGNAEEADAGGEIWVWYAPAQDTIFEIQNDAAMTYILGAPGAQLDHTLTAATAHGSRTTSRSSVELTSLTNGDVIVVAQPEYVDNDMVLANARYHVMFRGTPFRAPADATV